MQEYYDVMKQAKHNEEQLGVWEAAHAGIPYSNTRGIPREHFFFFHVAHLLDTNKTVQANKETRSYNIFTTQPSHSPAFSSALPL